MTQTHRRSKVIDTLQQRHHFRARIRAIVRRFFADRNVVEVDTPALSEFANPDPAIEPFLVQSAAKASPTLYLHSSPELAMKRLLCAGSGDIYQLCRVFRDAEIGRWHEPEFMMLEWYRLGFSADALMDEAADLIGRCLAHNGKTLEVCKLSYREVFENYLSVDPLADPLALRPALLAQFSTAGREIPHGMTSSALLDLAFATLIAPVLPKGQLVFIYDYPAAQCSLARIRPTEPPVAARFEVFLNGIELGNGFEELTDAREQRRRFEQERQDRLDLGLPAPPIDEPFLQALDGGMPDCAGLAIGFDRLVAAAAGCERLADAVDLPHSAASGS